MEVLEACSTQMSNKEVLDLLRNNISKKQTNLATILYETTSYLESSPAASCSLQSLAEFLDIIAERKYDLTKFEKIQIVNLKPSNPTELHLLVDNIEEKLSEDDRTELLSLINNMKPDQDEINRKKLKR